MPFIIESQRGGRAGARRLAVVAVVVSMAFAIGSVLMLAGTADAATGAGLAVGSPAASPTWKIQSTRNPSGSDGNNLEGVSCTSATACTAVGYYYSPSGSVITLAEQWNGTTWTIHTGPTVTSLNGVSCTSASACTAVGSILSNSGDVVTRAERWNGTSWTTQTTPNPPGPTDVFSGVSCSSASACTPVGSYAEGNAEPTGPFAERWNGTTWMVQTTPSPAGADESPLNSVSCTAASTCTAVGEYQDSSGTYLTLAERESG